MALNKWDLYDCGWVEEDREADRSPEKLPSPTRFSIPAVDWVQLYPVNYRVRKLLSEGCSRDESDDQGRDYSNRMNAERFKMCYPPDVDAAIEMMSRVAARAQDSRFGAWAPMLKLDQGFCLDRTCVRQGVCFHRFTFRTIAGRPWFYEVELGRDKEEIKADLGVMHNKSGTVRMCRAAFAEQRCSLASASSQWWDFVWPGIFKFLSVYDLVQTARWLPSLEHSRLPRFNGRDHRRLVPHTEVFEMTPGWWNSRFRSDVLVPVLHIPYRVDRVALALKWSDQGWGNTKGLLYALYLKKKDSPDTDRPTNSQDMNSHPLTTAGPATQWRPGPRLVVDHVKERELETRDKDPGDCYPPKNEAAGNEPAIESVVSDSLWEDYAILGVSVPANLLGERDLDTRVELPPELVSQSDRIVVCCKVGGGGGHTLNMSGFSCLTVQHQVLPPGPGRRLSRLVFGKRRLQECILSFLHPAAQEPLKTALGARNSQLLVTSPQTLWDLATTDRRNDLWRRRLAEEAVHITFGGTLRLTRPFHPGYVAEAKILAVHLAADDKLTEHREPEGAPETSPLLQFLFHYRPSCLHLLASVGDEVAPASEMAL